MRTHARDAKAIERAFTLERNAEAADDDDAWQVAADAWEEAGDPERARFAWVRQPSINPHIIDRTTAERIRWQLDRWSAAERLAFQDRGPQIPLTPAEERRIYYSLGFERPIPAEVSALRVFELAETPFERIDARISNTRQHVTTAHGDNLGTVITRSPTAQRVGFNIRARILNGYEYVGHCTAHNDLCFLRRSKPWLARLRYKRR